MQLQWPLVAIPLTIWSLNRSSENIIIHGIFYEVFKVRISKIDIFFEFSTQNQLTNLLILES